MKLQPLAIGMLAGILMTTHALAIELAGNDTNGGSIVRSSPRNGIPLSQSFFFAFHSSDHELKSIGFRNDTPQFFQTTITYADQNGDDPYQYLIQHYDAPVTGIQTFHTGTQPCAGGHCQLSVPPPPFPPPGGGSYVFVLQGFLVQYAGTDDHHLDQFGIREDGGILDVAFNDRNDDDDFTYEVHYAYVPRTRFSNIGESSGTANGAQRKVIPNGNAVLRGFNFDYHSSDHQVDEIGIILRGDGTVEAAYNDQNDDDTFSWVARWGIVN